MKGEKHCELGQHIKSISTTFSMIDDTKYLVQFEMKNIFCHIIYTINIPIVFFI